MRNKKATAAVAALIFLLCSLTAAEAQSPCNLKKSDFDKLSSIGGGSANSSDYGTELAGELRLRKNLLGKVVDCASVEVASEASDLRSVKTDDGNLEKLILNILGQLDDVSRYYDTQRVLIKDLGLAGSKIFAQSFSDWRDGNYKPLAAHVNNLIIWMQNQPLFGTARVRLDQINRTVAFFGVAQDDEVRGLLGNAEDNLSQALDANEQTRTAILTSDDSASLAMKNSLELLSKTYKNFFDLSGTIGKNATGTAP